MTPQSSCCNLSLVKRFQQNAQPPPLLKMLARPARSFNDLQLFFVISYQVAIPVFCTQVPKHYFWQLIPANAPTLIFIITSSWDSHTALQEVLPGHVLGKRHVSLHSFSAFDIYLLGSVKLEPKKQTFQSSKVVV